MKFPAIPPDDNAHWTAFNGDAKKVEAREELHAFVAQMPYEHWDIIRFKPVPKPFSAKDVWAVVKLNRWLSGKNLPFKDKKGGDFSYVPTASSQRALHEIDSNARGFIGMEGATASAEGRDVYLQKNLIEEPFSSSVLEGAVTTREIARKMVEEQRPAKTLDERMVLNNYEAMRYVREHRDAPLTPARILEIHRILTKDTLEKPEKVGVLRDAADKISVMDNDGEILHEPPPADQLPARLEKLCAFANDDKGEFLHPIIRAIVLHFMLAYDHPFWDGNGRCARALFYWCALRHGYWLLEYVSISAVLNRAPKQYGLAFLYTETDGGDVTYFIDHQLGVIEQSLADLRKYLQKRASELSSLGKTLGKLERLLNRRQLPLIQEALKSPKAKYTIDEQRKLHGVSYLTARADLETLAEMGFLKKGKEGVKIVFTVPDNLKERLERKAG